MNGEGSLLVPDISLFPTLRYLHSDFTNLLLFFFTIPFYRSLCICACVRARAHVAAHHYTPWKRAVSFCFIVRDQSIHPHPPPKPLVVRDLHSLGLSDRKPGIRAALNQRYTIIQPFRKLVLILLSPPFSSSLILYEEYFIYFDRASIPRIIPLPFRSPCLFFLLPFLSFLFFS